MLKAFFRFQKRMDCQRIHQSKKQKKMRFWRKHCIKPVLSKNNDGANGEISGDNCSANGGRDVRKAQYKLVCYSKYNAKDKPYIANINADCDNETYDADVVEAYVSGAILEFAVRYSDEMKNRCVRTKDIAEQLTEEYERLEERYRRAVKTYTMFGDESMLEQAQAFETDMKRISREIDTAREKARISAGLEERINLLRTLPDSRFEMFIIPIQRIIQQQNASTCK